MCEGKIIGRFHYTITGVVKVQGKEGARMSPLANFGNLSPWRKVCLYLVLLPHLAAGRRAAKREAAAVAHDLEREYPLRERAELEEA